MRATWAWAEARRARAARPAAGGEPVDRRAERVDDAALPARMRRDFDRAEMRHPRAEADAGVALEGFHQNAGAIDMDRLSVTGATGAFEQHAIVEAQELRQSLDPEM
ncbi:hypothetical protein WOA01_23810 [Methylocystis sp. IM2]|uniref:hypothetical protein n=1 Tax=Methylocystis sp. IM4 TaxID=3136560 RepID=UPI0030F94E28